jgi:hypothetical protein
MTMPKRKATEPDPEAPVPMDDPEQSRRFIEAARAAGCDPGDPRILDVLKGLASRPPQPRGKKDASGTREETKKPGRAKE